MRSTLVSTLFSVLVFTSVVGCGSEQKEPEAPPPPAEAAPVTPAPAGKETDDPRQSSITISDRIKTACGINESETHFAYNSARVASSEKTIFKKLADCFTTGPLKGLTMHLVGHADPRGEPEYNMQLGEKRAGNVAKAVIAEGLPQAQVTTTSRGELDATGTDEASWAEDRRVNINVAD